MSGTIREVPNPNDEGQQPQHEMSEIGQQRLAALEQQEKLVTDADGGTANVETGEYTAPPAPEQPTAPTPVVLDTVDPLEGVRAEWADDAAAYRQDIATIAQ